MLEYRGFNAWISCGGQILPAYAPAVDVVNKNAFCLIPSQEGQPFAVHWRDNNSGIQTAAYINLDGITVPGRYLFGKGEAQRTGVRTGPNSERPFVFTKAEGGSTGNAPQTDAYSGMHGSITLRIRQVRCVGWVAPNVPPLLPATGSVSSSRMPEHVVGYGAETRTHRQTASMHFEPYDPTNPGSFATFVFFYRTKEWLDQNGFRPMSAPAATLPAALTLPPAEGTTSTETGWDVPALGKRTREATTTTASSRKFRRTDPSASASASTFQVPQYVHGPIVNEHLPAGASNNISAPPLGSDASSSLITTSSSRKPRCNDASASAFTPSSNSQGSQYLHGTTGPAVSGLDAVASSSNASFSAGASSSRALSSRVCAVKQEQEEEGAGTPTGDLLTAQPVKFGNPDGSARQYPSFQFKRPTPNAFLMAERLRLGLATATPAGDVSQAAEITMAKNTDAAVSFNSKATMARGAYVLAPTQATGQQPGSYSPNITRHGSVHQASTPAAPPVSQPRGTTAAHDIWQRTADEVWVCPNMECCAQFACAGPMWHHLHQSPACQSAAGPSLGAGDPELTVLRYALHDRR